MASLNNPFDKSTTTTRPDDAARDAVLRDRIDNLTQRHKVPPSTLSTFHRNPRKGDVKAIAASLKAHDQYKPITVNIGTHTGRPHEVLAGNHTLMAIRDLAERHPDDERWANVLVHWVDVDDDRCNRIVAVDNQTAQLGGFDVEELAALLDDIGEVNLGDIGFSDADFADLKAQIEENALELPPKPEGLRDITNNPGAGTQERKDSYEDTATRMMILTLPIPRFVWAQEMLAQLREEHGQDSNVDMILQLIADATNSEVPDVDAEVSADQIDAADDQAANAASDPEAE